MKLPSHRRQPPRGDGAAPGSGEAVQARRCALRHGLGIAIAAVTGCAAAPSPPPPPPPKLSVNVVAATYLNPDINGRASPVVLRVYELESPTQFTNAHFHALFDQDRATLASEIVAREEFVLRPGETKAIDKLLAPDTQAIGVMALFRDLERARWRAVAALTPAKDNIVTVVVDGIELRAIQTAR